LTNITAGSYPFTIYYDSSCIVIDTAIVHEPSLMTILANATDVLCYGDSTGTLALTVIGGTTPYYIDYFGLNPTSLSAGDYLVMVTDNNGCTEFTNHSINEPSPLTISEVILENANNGANGSIQLTVSGGVPPYQYLWNNGDEDELNDLIGQGMYTVEIEDALGCPTTSTFSIIDVSVVEQSNGGILIAPNPAHDRISFRFDYKTHAIWQIVNAAGQTILRSNNTLDHTLDVSEWASGLYHLRYFTHGLWYNTRFVIE
jgi:hypothetical protein